MNVTGFKFSPPKNKLHKKYKVMKITGFLVQCCNRILNEDEVYGIITNPNMFNVLESLKTVPANNSQVHFCNECYQQQVIKQADLIVYKKNNVEGWTNKVKELAYLFKKSCMENKGKRILTDYSIKNEEITAIPIEKTFKKLGRDNKKG